MRHFSLSDDLQFSPRSSVPSPLKSETIRIIRDLTTDVGVVTGLGASSKSFISAAVGPQFTADRLLPLDPHWSSVTDVRAVFFNG